MAPHIQKNLTTLAKKTAKVNENGLKGDTFALVHNFPGVFLSTCYH